MKKAPLFPRLGKSMIANFLFILIPLFVFVLLVLTILWSIGMKNAVTTVSSSHIFDIVQSSNAKFDETLETIVSANHQIASSSSALDVCDGDPAAAVRLEELIDACSGTLDAYLYGMAVFGVNGQSVIRGSVSRTLRNSADSLLEKTRALYPQDGFFTQQPSYNTSSRSLIIASAIWDGAAFKGIVLAECRPSLFIKSFGMVRMDGLIRTVILDKDQEVFFCNDGALSQENLRKIIQEGIALPGSRPTLVQTDDGKQYMLIKQSISRTGWINIAFFDNYIIEKSYTHTLFNSMLFSAVFLLVMLLLIGSICYIYAKRVYRLTHILAGIDLNDIDTALSALRVDKDMANANEFERIEGEIHAMLSKISVQAEEISRLHEKQRQVDLSVLRSQLNMHFLYNTLQVIVNLAKIQGERNIQNVAESLIRLLQYSVGSESRMVTLGDEVAYIKSYVVLMQHKFLNDVSVYYEIDSALLSCQCIKLLLQPVVENAFKYAFTDTGGNYILIKASRVADHVELKITDNGKGISQEQLQEINSPAYAQGEHLGLTNLRRRLRLTYGEGYDAKLYSLPGVYTTVIITIPYTQPPQ